MKLLNLACGAIRSQDTKWTNLDNLYEILLPETPERMNLEAEKNYVNHKIGEGQLPFYNDTFDSILCSHALEHFDCMAGERLIHDCRRILKDGGWLMISVPDASKFKEKYPFDCPENAVELFGEPIYMPDGEDTFFGYALWNRFHKVILTEDALWAYFIRAGFRRNDIYRWPYNPGHDELKEMSQLLNRHKFSLVMVVQK